MPTLSETVERTWSRWVTEPEVERAVFGTDDARAVGAAYERFAADVLGSSVASALFYEATVTCVAGLVLADGRRVCVRAYQPNRTSTFLQQVAGVQSHLSAAGFAVPEPLFGPVTFDGRLHTVETVVDDPGPPDGRDPVVREVAVPASGGASTWSGRWRRRGRRRTRSGRPRAPSTRRPLAALPLRPAARAGTPSTSCRSTSWPARWR